MNTLPEIDWTDKGVRRRAHALRQQAKAYRETRILRNLEHAAFLEAMACNLELLNDLHHLQRM